ncbi:MAG: cell division protein ZipA C-terminal FtsZ-binding domain-containing protein [Gammaproteobacteria bacterium]
MWQLRLIIVLIGLVFIALVYLLSRQRKSRRALRARDEPTLDGLDTLHPPLASHPTSAPRPVTAATKPAVECAPIAAPVSAPAAAPCAHAGQLIVALHVAGRAPTPFSGARVLAALQANGLQYGPLRVFERPAKTPGDGSAFCVANMVEPGELTPELLAQQPLTGLTLFLVLPGPRDALGACADMIATARALAAQLGGEVQNENHSVFSVEDAQHIRQRVLEFQTRV